MPPTSTASRKISWQTKRERVNLLADMALNRQRVAEKIARLREMHDLTQEQAASRAGVTLRQWQRWESGDSMPYPRNLGAIAEEFGIDAGEFFAEAEDPRPPSQLDRIDAKLDAIMEHLKIADPNAAEVLRISSEIEADLDRHRAPSRAPGTRRPKRSATGNR